MDAAHKQLNAAVLALDAATGQCFHITEILAVTDDWVDARFFDTRFNYSVALRVELDAHGALRRARCLNFEPPEQYERKTLGGALMGLGRAVVVPELAQQRVREDARAAALRRAVPVPVEPYTMESAWLPGGARLLRAYTENPLRPT